MERQLLLNKLINMDEPVELLLYQLAKFSWDSKENLVIIKKQQVLNVIDKFLKGEINQSDVEKWANSIECREDIGVEAQYKELIKEIIFELANPDLVGEIAIAKAKTLRDRLTWNSSDLM